MHRNVSAAGDRYCARVLARLIFGSKGIDLRSGVARHVKDKSVLGLGLILVLLAGVAIGFALATRYRAENPVAIYPNRTDSTYEKSLRGYVVLLDSLHARDASVAGRQIYAADKALLLMRLADLAEQRGSSAESTRLTADALAVCSTDGLPYCSSDELRQRAQNLDVILESVKQPK